MKTAYAVGLALLATGCSPSANTGNGHTLWIAPNGSELVLKLQPVEPEPY